jgi:hypothetical protein
MTQPSTAVARNQTPVDLNDPLSDLDQAFRLAQLLAQSSMVPQALRGSPQNCLVTMLLGRELGLSWIQSIRGIYVLPSGQPGLRGALLLARIRAAGHRYEFIESDDACEFVLKRKDEEFKISHTGKFGVEDAKAAGLVHEKDGKLIARSNSGQPLPWESYRRDMLQWRAVARGAARGCPELIFGFDLAGVGDADGGGNTVTAEVIPAQQQTAGDAQALRQQLAELDQVHAATIVEDETPLPRADAGESPKPEAAGGSHELADYDVEGLEQPTLDDTETETPARGTPPGLPELHELLRRCGYTGHAQVNACAILVHRHLSDMGQLTPGEIFMVHDAVSRVALGESTVTTRHQALEQHLDMEKSDTS